MQPPEQKAKKPFCKKWWFIAIVVVFVLGIFGSMIDGSPSEDSAAAVKDMQSVETTEVESPAVENEAAPAAAPVEEAPVNSGEDVPREYKNALRKAETYVKVMHMSKRGVYGQLTSEYGEGFSPEAAQYAVDNLDADYNKAALEKGLFAFWSA